MNFYHIVAFVAATVLAVAVAAPVEDPTTVKPIVEILKKKSVVNEDGSYVYGYEGADGSFKVETRDRSGYVSGKYGYIDADGLPRVVEYTAGTGTGFIPSADHLPVPDVPITVVKSQRTPEDAAAQRVLDGEYNSVDADEDGIPDGSTGRSGLPYARDAVPYARKAVPYARDAVPYARTQPLVEDVVKVVEAPVKAAPARAHLEVPVVRAPVARVEAAPMQVAPAARVQAAPSQRAPVAQVDASPLPVPVAPQFIRESGISPLEQFLQDQDFNSVDLNEDGIPDSQQHILLAQPHHTVLLPQNPVPLIAEQHIIHDPTHLFTLNQDGQFVPIQNGAFQVQDGQILNFGSNLNGFQLVQQPQLISNGHLVQGGVIRFQ